MTNKGWELMADLKAFRNKNWLVSFNINLSQNINTFNKLPENFNTERSTSIGNGQYPLRVVEGEPIGSFLDSGILVFIQVTKKWLQRMPMEIFFMTLKGK